MQACVNPALHAIAQPMGMTFLDRADLIGNNRQKKTANPKVGGSIR